MTLAAATDPALHQIVLLMTSDSADDQTSLSGGTWVRHQATPERARCDDTRGSGPGYRGEDQPGPPGGRLDDDLDHTARR